MPQPTFGRRNALRYGGVAIATLGTLGTPGCLGGGPADRAVVGMTTDFRFDPSPVTIDAGGTVRWENSSDVAHTVTAYADRIPRDAAYFASGGFDSERAARDDVSAGIIGPDEAYEHPFERSGIYDYYCIPHEGSGMVGRVRVD